MQPLPDMWGQEDDWTGITSAAERKRRQNRLNQRAWRRRKTTQNTPLPLAAEQQLQPTTTTTPKSSPPKRHQNGEPRGRQQQQRSPPTATRTREEVTSYLCALYDDSGPLFLTDPALVRRARDLLRRAYHDYVLRSPRPESLHMVIRLNLFNALARNAVVMGFPIEGLCSVEHTSPFNSYGPLPLSLLPASSPPADPGLLSSSSHNCTSYPAALHPTVLQRSIKHHPWIDLFPFPAFRDNILVAMQKGHLNDDDLCLDVLELWAPGIETRPALVVWGGPDDDPSDWRFWEASPAFVRKWGWLLRGSPEMLRATNFWRERRGQSKIECAPIDHL